MLIVQVCDFGSDGDAHYRLHDPSRQMGRLDGVTTVDCHFFSRRLPELAALADVLVLQFVNDWDFLSLCRRRRAAGKVTIFEANDYFFDVQSWNPIAPFWHDRSNQELYLQFLAQADGVQTTTEELARRWRERGARQTAVFRNYLSEIPPLPAPPHRPLTIGWGGSPGHLADWYAIAPELGRWLDAHPEVNLAVMTDEPARDFFRLPPERYFFQPFGSIAQYLAFLERLDIGIAPLLPTDYNRCRSDVKFMEYASRGVAGIYADLEPYRGSVIPGETGLFYRTPGELIEQLELLRLDAELRMKLRRQGYQHVTGLLNRDSAADRVAWYRSLMTTEPTAISLPLELAGIAMREGRYLQFPPEEPERTLVEVLHKGSSPESLAAIAKRCEQQPSYLIAMQHHGRILNDRTDHQAAMAVLERARLLAPDNPRTLNEIGRTWFLLGDVPRARRCMEESIGLNLYYLPAWQYLLRLLGWHPDASGPQWSRRAEELFPACYPIALLGTRTCPPAEAVQRLLRLLDHHVPTLTRAERPVALARFRDTILPLVQKLPPDDAVLKLLKTACELFPESAKLAGEWGAALYRAGRIDEALEHQSRALVLRQQSDIIRGEFGPNDPPPLAWRLAQHIMVSNENR